MEQKLEAARKRTNKPTESEASFHIALLNLMKYLTLFYEPVFITEKQD